MKIPNREKKPIKLIKILKKPTGSVRFWFYKLDWKKNQAKTKKTKSNWKTESNRKKTEPKPVWTDFFS